MQNHFKNELHNVLSGKSEVRSGAIIRTSASYLNDGAQTSGNLEIKKHFKKQETKKLEDYISTHKLWVEITEKFWKN